MASAYNIDDEVVYLTDEAAGTVAKGTIDTVSKLESTYTYKVSDNQYPIYESMICGKFKEGATSLKSSASTILTRIQYRKVASLEADYSEYISSSAKNIDALFA
jgi:hypothetical protein